MEESPAAAPAAAVPLEQRESVRTLLEQIAAEFPTFVLLGVHKDAGGALFADPRSSRTPGAVFGQLVQGCVQVGALHGVELGWTQSQAPDAGQIIMPTGAPARRRRGRIEG